MIKYTERDNAITFEIVVQPRSGRNQVVGEVNGALKVRLSAPPIEGRANAECVRFLADFFAVRQSEIEIVTGKTAKKKMIRIRGLSGAELSGRISGNVSPS